MFKIQLENGEFYKSKSGRVQHYTLEKADAKIQKLGERASGAKAIQCNAKIASVAKGAKIEKAEKVAKSKKADAKAVKGEKAETKTKKIK
jgi:hypothetical protein